ncbi:putative DNA (cytosine-5)-methyltransferase CMT1 isoform X2 [Diospyros lotus]|uniref:putative DNA (cytosine-5)-methyltransferase CMT1 isoform X2 n=1 Tax=Diospyros lotus TaxID=55363 RepID=UPI0022549E4D|nr:putative DNA (cytosine-5)-methyltransferase CMT1 isoform X2 [Diospyros lotus]
MGNGGKRRWRPQEISSFQSTRSPKKAKHSPQNEDVMFFGKPVPAEEARKRWPLRYQSKRKAKPGASSMASDDAESNDKYALQAKCHYTQAVVDGVPFNLLDDAYVKGEEGKPDFIAKIVELFETIDEELYFTAQWFFRAEDTVIKHQSNLIDKQRVFYSDLRDDNPLTCIVSKVKIVQLGVNINLGKKEKAILSSDLYCDMAYSVPHFSFTTLHTNTGNSKTDSEASSISDASSNSAAEESDLDAAKLSQVFGFQVCDMTLLDLYSGCGAMSTGLCLGASLSNLKLIMRWAVDTNSYACKSLKQNHPEAVVRNEAALDFLCLLKEWEKLCKEFQLISSQQNEDVNSEQNNLGNEEDDDVDDGPLVPKGEFEVGKLVAVCYGDPNNVKKQGLYFKINKFELLVLCCIILEVAEFQN